MSKEQIGNEITPKTLTKTKENTFHKIFNTELSKRIVNFLRKHGYYVTTHFNLDNMNCQILVTTVILNQTNGNQAHFNEITKTAKFIKINIIKPYKQCPKNYVLWNGGIYLFISTFQQFYELFVRHVLEFQNSIKYIEKTQEVKK